MVITTPIKIYLDKSPIHGWGVFANQPIDENEIIEICPVIDMGVMFGEVTHILIDYRFNWPQGTPNYEKQVVCSGYGMMYNHSEIPNAAWRSNIENNTFEFYSIKPIRPQEEIFVWYGDMNYWNDGRQHTNVI
jgi:SET domain-containing protein